MFDVAVKLIIIALACLGTLFASSHLFFDSQIMSKWFMMLGCFLLLASYCIIKLLLNSSVLTKSSKNIEFCILGVVIATTSCQALYGILQYFNILSPTASFQVTGSFDNPAGFAASLCAAFPFYLLAFIKSKKALRWSIGCLSALVIVAVILSESRAGILSLIVILFYFGVQRLKLCSKIKWVLIPLLLLGIVIGLYLMKKDSADGRLLIWKCSLMMIKDKWLVGYGTGGFEAHYMDYQANYFRNHPDSSYNQLADNVQYPFCEYLNIGINYGIVGLCFTFCTIGYMFRRYYKDQTSEKETAFLCLLAIMIFALFSYPLMYPFVWIMLLYSGYLLVNKPIDGLCSYASELKFVMVQFVSCLIVYSSIQVFHRVRVEFEWKEVSNLSLLGKTEEAMSKYKEIYPYLKTDRYFLYNYSMEYFHSEKYQESLNLALQCRKYWADYDVEMLLGQLYEHLQQPEKAEQYYWQASYMCPSRFMPLYRLVFLLEKEQQQKKASQIAKRIINKPEKVHSHFISLMKREMNDFIDRE